MIKQLRYTVKIFLQQIFSLLAGYGLQSSSVRFNGYSRLRTKTSFGKNVHFNGIQTYGAGHVYIGDNFHSGRGLIILTQNHNYKGSAIPYDEKIEIRDVKIGDNVWIGINVLILPGVTIGEGAIIQAGSVVSRSIPPLGIAGGNPAVPFRFRDKDHYFQLKKEGRFH